MRHFKLTLAYDGADFHGWQIQPGKPTIQGTLHGALRRLAPRANPESLPAVPPPEASGRTDAGVHALAQVVSCALDSPIPARGLQSALNDTLPPAIRVTDIEEVAKDFHPRRWAKRKTYRYRMLRNEICSPFMARYVAHYPYPLDEAAMLAAAPLIIGEHDFASFAAVDPERRTVTGSSDEISEKSFDEEDDDASHPRSKVRTVFESSFERAGEELIYTVRGSGFLHHMVRNLVGTFTLVGKGTLTPADVTRILAAKDRSAAGHTAPAAGLYLVHVDY